MCRSADFGVGDGEVREEDGDERGGENGTLTSPGHVEVDGDPVGDPVGDPDRCVSTNRCSALTLSHPSPTASGRGGGVANRAVSWWDATGDAGVVHGSEAGPLA